MDLDSILDEALDEFEEQELSEKAAAAQRDRDDSTTYQDPEQVRRQQVEQMRKLLAEMDNPQYGEVLQNTLRDLSSTTEGNETVDDLFASIEGRFEGNFQPSFLPKGPDDEEGIAGADRTVAATLQMLANAQKGMEG